MITPFDGHIDNIWQYLQLCQLWWLSQEMLWWVWRQADNNITILLTVAIGVEWLHQHEEQQALLPEVPHVRRETSTGGCTAHQEDAVQWKYRQGREKTIRRGQMAGALSITLTAPYNWGQFAMSQKCTSITRHTHTRARWHRFGWSAAPVQLPDEQAHLGRSNSCTLTLGVRDAQFYKLFSRKNCTSQSK